MAIAAYALTSASSVKTRLSISVTTWDTLIPELINAATDMIEKACGGRRFKSATYTNEVYSLEQGQKLLALRHFPVTALSAASYRAGTPGTPAWTSLQTDDYELDGSGSLGVVRLYAAPYGPNIVRFTYTAGYSTLPYDIVDLCERLTIKMFNRRTDEGKSNQSSQESAVTWEALLTDTDKLILSRYSRPHFA